MKRSAGLGIALGTAVLLVAGCYGGEYPHINEVVLHQSERQTVLIRNPFPEEIRLIEPIDPDPSLWGQLQQYEEGRVDTAIPIPPGGAYRLPFHVVTVTDDPPERDLVIPTTEAPVSYLREDKLPREPGYLVQNGPTIRMLVERAGLPPTEVLLSLYGCPETAWADGPAREAMHLVIADQPVPYRPQVICPRG